MKQIKTTCTIKERNGKLSPVVPVNVQDHVQQLLQYCIDKKGGFISFSLNAPKTTRSTGKNSMNTHLNGHIGMIANETGNDSTDVKKYLKNIAIDRGYPVLQDEAGNDKLDLWGNRQGISESDSSIEECAILIECAHQFAAEYGIKLIEE